MKSFNESCSLTSFPSKTNDNFRSLPVLRIYWPLTPFKNE